MNSLEVMCGGLRRALAEDHGRERVATRNLERARALAERFFLTHRTVGGTSLENILSHKRLHAGQPCTQREIDCGVDRAIYFFLGCAAYPEGSIAFVVPTHLLQRMRASYSPFDSGSLEEHARPRDPSEAWDEPDKLAFLAAHLGDGTDVVAFCGEYIAAHFEDTVDYVLRPQHSKPDFPVYHDLVSTGEDRRVWSIEVQLHEDLDLDTDHVEAIVLGQPDLLVDIPDDLVETTVIAEDEGSIASSIQRLIVRETSSP